MENSLLDMVIALLNLKKNRSYTILDIGCGGGELLEAMIPLIGACSRLVGTDARPTVIEKAQAKKSAIDFRHHRFSETLPFANEEFDIVLSTDMLECIVHKGALLWEVARILKPHGQVLFAHWDWDTQVYASEQTQLIRQMVHAFADWQQEWMDASDGMMGRKLRGLFQRTKHFEGRMEVFTLTETSYQPGLCGYERLRDLQSLVDKQVLSATDYRSIQEEMESLDREGAYFYSLNSYIYIGERCPAALDLAT